MEKFKESLAKLSPISSRDFIVSYAITNPITKAGFRVPCTKKCHGDKTTDT